MSTEIKLKTCPWCGHKGEVLSYLAKVGGSDAPVPQVHCKNIDACQERIEANK